MTVVFVPKFTDDSRADYLGLDHSQQIQVNKSLIRIEQLGMQAGQALHGKLADCRKLKHKRLGLRVIFRQGAEAIEIIEIVVIGKREDEQAYAIAAERLGR